MSVVSNFDAEQVMGELQKENFDIGDNPYGQLTSIIDYTTSIFNAIESLHQSWIGAVGDADFYFSNGENVQDSEIDPTGEADFLNEGQKGSLTGVNTSLNIRSGAGTNNNVVGSITAGTTFTIVGSKVGADGYTWYKVRTSDGKEGYSRGDYIKVDTSYQKETLHEQQQHGLPDNTLKVTPDKTTSQYTIDEKQQHNNPTKVVPDTSYQSQTLHERQQHGDSEGIVKLKDPNSHLNIRSTTDNSSNSNIVGQFSNGERIDILGEEKGYYKIETESGDIGYVSKQYIDIPADSSKINYVNSAVPESAKVKLTDPNSNLNIRSSPNRAATNNVIGSLKDSTEVKVLDRSGSWTKINYNGQEGWVYSNYLDK